MDIHGTLSENLRATLKSVLRFRSLPVHKDTFAYWHDLLNHGQNEIRNGHPSPEVSELVRKLGMELMERRNWQMNAGR